MAESFFGFDAGGAPSGLGKGRNTKPLEGGSLLPATEDDEIDALNDETFGDGGVWDFDAAEKADLGESFFDDDSRGFDSAYSTAEKQGREDEEYSEMPQMEQSLSALVVDDEDEINDPAIVNMSKSRPIPKRKQNLDELFGPASPPGLLDTDDLVSPSHKNIWRPPDKDHFNFESPGQQHYQGPVVVTAGRPPPPGLPNRNVPSEPKKGGAMTLEELERQMRDQTVPQQRQVSPPLGGIPMPIGTPPHHHHMPIGTPPQLPQHQQRPFFYTPQAGHGQGPWISTPGPTPNRISPPQVVPQQQIQAQMLSGFMNQPPPRGVRSESPFHPGGMPMRRTPSPTMSGPLPVDNRGMPLNLSPAMIAKLYPHLLRTPVGQMRGGMQMNAPASARPGRISPPNHMNNSFMTNTPQGPPRMPQRMPFTDPTHMRQQNRERWQDEQHDRSYYNNQNRGGGYQRGYRGEGDYRGNQGYRGRGGYHNNSYHQHYDNEPREPEDEYANLMTQREKDWIIKIQMMQLTTDNPYVDDYYYTQYKIKLMALERRRQRGGQGGDDKEPKLLLPQFAKVETSAYSPAQFEGSLGKLTASSVHNPRQIIDAKIRAGDVEMKGGKYRQLLLYIEQIYNVLLQVDDLEKQVLALPPNEREALYTERRTKINQMFAKLHCDSNAPEQFVMYMSIRKGKKLVNRMMPLLNKDQLVSIVLATLKNLPILIKKDVLDEVLPDLYNHVSQVIKNAVMQDLVMFGLAMQNAAVPTSQTNPLMSALQNRFGVSAVCCMMSRAETIYVESPMDVDNSQQDQWSDFVIMIGETLSIANERTLTLPKPLERFHNLIAHFERVLSRNVLSGLEDRLRAWTQG
ncbi:protein PAT1 homolog 1-like isoform X2 [Lineus longissimus]|uniref:protein PAT1 homolog 1-like isoform X2 n=1 Tax=Lineus longissimus TaxID=88925 RepID=UPI002B4D4253